MIWDVGDPALPLLRDVHSVIIAHGSSRRKGHDLGVDDCAGREVYTIM